MSDPWRVTLLGGLRAERGRQVITRFKTQKVAALFAYLAFRPKQAHPREVLIELLWPESDVPTLRNSLSVALSSLRNQFEPPGVPQGTVIRADRFSVGLTPAVVTTDVAEFEQALKAAGRAGSSLEKAQHLTRAVELYQVPLLPGFYEDWIPAEHERLSGLFVDALETLVGYYEGQGDLQAAIGHARHAVSVDPLREEGQQHLIRLLAASGQPGAALRQYKDFERRLEEEVASEPSPALRSLFRRIEKDTGLTVPVAPVLRGQPTSPPPAGEPATVTFLLTDIEEATRWGREAPEAFERARERCLALLRQEVERRGGRVIKETGEGLIVAFGSARSALAGAVASQQALMDEEWTEGINKLRVRMALHTADVRQGGEGVPEAPAHQLAGRMLTAAHGGQVLVSEVTAALVPARSDDGIRLVDLGVYRFRDVDEPRRVFQVEFPGMEASEFGSLAADSGFRSNLPSRFTSFFGREQEIARLQELLRSPGVRLVTLSGPGGAGKTRLALECAERLEPHFEGAAYFVPLADLGEPLLIAPAILDCLRVQPGGLRDPLDQAVEALNEKPTLLVLDNFEHLVEVGSQVLQALLNRVPSVKLLITSRQLLGLSAEREFVVPPLPTPDGDESAEQLSLFDSVQLFIDRAQQVMPHFQVTNANAPAIAALVGGLEGIPLAIELAAGRVQVLTPAQMLAQLSQRLDFLATRKRDVTDRQASLRAALNWSYRLLTPELQRFFARLSVFNGGWSIEAAEAVCEEPLALDYLEQLRECSLVLPGENEEDSLRFRMLETLREYCQGCLEERGEAALFRRRHCEHFLELVESAEPFIDVFVGRGRLPDPDSVSARWRERIELDYGNVRAALDWSLRHCGSIAVRMAGALYSYWLIRGHSREGRRWLTDVSQHVPRRSNPEWAKALYGAGVLSWAQDDYQQARSYLEESLVLYTELDDKVGVVGTLNCLGNVALRQGDYPRSIRAHEEAITVRAQLGTTGFKCSLTDLGKAIFESGDQTRGLMLLTEGVAVSRAEGVPGSWLANALTHLERARYYAGDSSGAIAALEECLALFREAGNPLGLSSALDVYGLVAVRQNDLIGARLKFRESLEIRRELGDQRGIADSLAGFAAVASKTASPARAARLLGAAQRIRGTIGEFTPECQRREQDQWTEAARAAIGLEAFEAELARGHAMTLEQAIEFALRYSEEPPN